MCSFVILNRLACIHWCCYTASKTKGASAGNLFTACMCLGFNAIDMREPCSWEDDKSLIVVRLGCVIAISRNGHDKVVIVRARVARKPQVESCVEQGVYLCTIAGDSRLLHKWRELKQRRVHDTWNVILDLWDDFGGEQVLTVTSCVTSLVVSHVKRMMSHSDWGGGDN